MYGLPLYQHRIVQWCPETRSMVTDRSTVEYLKEKIICAPVTVTRTNLGMSILIMYAMVMCVFAEGIRNQLKIVFLTCTYSVALYFMSNRLG